MATSISLLMLPMLTAHQFDMLMGCSRGLMTLINRISILGSEKDKVLLKSLVISKHILTQVDHRY